jgi:murein DD-endopeptidase MepM/ murein hydrolase activator NlpD
MPPSDFAHTNRRARRRPLLLLALCLVAAAVIWRVRPVERSLGDDIHLPPKGGPHIFGSVPALDDMMDQLRTAWLAGGAPLTVEQLQRRAAHIQPPIPGAKPSTRHTHWPGAPRAYRGGTHFGLDYYSGASGITITPQTRVRSIADGWVIRVDHGYRELTEAQRAVVLERAKQAGDDDPAAVDPLHGRQVWVLHAGGLLSRYSHLSATDPALKLGEFIPAGRVLGLVGNSGTRAGAAGADTDHHLHLELYVDWRPAWAGMSQQDVVASLAAILTPR